MNQDKSEIAKLLSFVRKHQSYTGDKIKNEFNPYVSIDKWIKSCNIDKGTNAIKAFVLHSDYKSWCNDNNIEKKDIAKCKTFNVVMKEMLNYKINQRNVIFYVNKKVKYEPSKKEKEDGQEAKN
jgi:hypothetical protein